ncbi:MAG: hypothetical protein WDM79_02695 [Terricaulis sp.]
MTTTPHQRAEAELTAYGLTFPETSAGPGWTVTRALYVRRKCSRCLAPRASRSMR